MNIATWDKKYLELAKYIATNWSKDPSGKVAAILVNYEIRQEFVGYNGFPEGVDDTQERYENRELKYLMVVHAEANALRKAGHWARNGTLYVYPSFAVPPICNECAKMAIQCGIKEIVGYDIDSETSNGKRWADRYQVSLTMLTEAGITWRTI